MRKEIECIVKGRVQGVAYRLFACACAVELGLTGAAENMMDGTVKVIAQGEEETLAAFIEQLKKGPSHAQVTDVAVVWREASGNFSDFKIL